MLVPTPRLLFLALAGLPLLVLLPSHDLALGAAAVWLAGVVVVALIDARFAPSRDSLVWERQHDEKLSLGAWNPVTLSLTNRSPRAVRFQVRDAVPPLLVSQRESGQGRCLPAEVWSLTYRVFPIHRGDYTFGPITYRALAPLGTVWRQSKVELDGRVKVYPNLQAVRSYDELVRRGRLEEIGLRTSRRWGAGTEFERLREYTPDDEYRRINWKATARRHTPIAVDYQTERSQNVIAVLDAGRLMSTRVPLPAELDPAGTRDALEVSPRRLRVRITATQLGRLRAPRALTRLDYAVNATLLLAYVSQEYGDRIGLLGFSDRVLRYLPPKPGRRQFLALTELLYNLEPDPTEADYAVGLGYLAARNPRRSLVVIFTDITEADAAGSLMAQVAHLARRHLPLVVTLRDPGVEALAAGPIDGPDAVYQRAVATTLLEERDKTLRRLRQAGVLTLDTSADRLTPSLVNRYLEIKARQAL